MEQTASTNGANIKQKLNKLVAKRKQAWSKHGTKSEQQFDRNRTTN